MNYDLCIFTFVILQHQQDSTVNISSHIEHLDFYCLHSQSSDCLQMILQCLEMFHKEAHKNRKAVNIDLFLEHKEQFLYILEMTGRICYDLPT